MLGVRIILFAAISVAIIEAEKDPDSRVHLQCKKIVWDVILNSCKGERVKRSADRSDLEKMDQEMTKIETGGVRAESNEQLYTNQQKRDYYYLQPRIAYKHLQFPMGYGFPGQDYISDTYQQSELSVPGLLDIENQYDSMVEENFRPPMGLPYRRMRYAIRSVNPDDLLGISLSPEELKELHEEIGDRLPRNPEDLHKIFQHVAAKCCGNHKLCYENPRMIPCMGFY